MLVPFSAMGHVVSQDIGKTAPELPKQSFLQRDTRKVKSSRGFLCCCQSGRALCVEVLRGTQPVLHPLQRPGMHKETTGGTDPRLSPRSLPFCFKQSGFFFPLPSCFFHGR